jgi:hypothetical protein
MSLSSMYVQSLVLLVSDYIPDAGLITVAGVRYLSSVEFGPSGGMAHWSPITNVIGICIFMVASNTGDCCQLWTTDGIYLGKKRTLTATLRSGYQEEDFAVSFRHLPN